MLGFAPISQLPLDTLPVHNVIGTAGFTESGESLAATGVENFTGTAGFTESGLALASSGTVVNPVTGTAGFTESGEALAAAGAVVGQIPVAIQALLLGINRHRQAQEAAVKEPKITKKAAAVEVAVKRQIVHKAKARFDLQAPELHATGFVLNPITGTARFREGKLRLRATGDVESITENDLMDLNLLEELIDA